MPEQIENRMVVDSQWDGLYKRKRKAYEEEEREEKK